MAEQALELKVPTAFARVLRYLESLSAEEFERALDLLSALPLDTPLGSVRAALGQELPEGEGLLGLVDFAISTRHLAFSLEADVATVASAVSKAAEIAQDRRQVLADRLQGLLDNKFVTIREKTQALSEEAPFVVTDSRCLTDLRPVFSSSTSTEGLLGLVVLHTLRLEVNGRDEPVFLTMNHSALVHLRQTLGRAMEKEARLDRIIRDLGETNLSVRSEE